MLRRHFAVLVLDGRRNFLNMISLNQTHLFIISIQQSISLNFFLEKFDLLVSKLFSVEVFNNISQLQSNSTVKRAASNRNVDVSQTKSDTCSYCICYLKVVKGQVSLSTVCGALRVYTNSSFFGYFDGHHKSTFKELWENLLHGFFSYKNKSVGISV